MTVLRTTYWTLIVVLVGLGMISIFSIGALFLALALGLVVLSPFRSRPLVFWPGLALVAGFLAGYTLVAPWSCSQTFWLAPDGSEVRSPVVCQSPLGIEYAGPEPFEPSRAPGLVAGASVAVASSLATWLLVSYRRGDRA